ncbi:FCD domain-containing protein [Lachnospiraceae bacterium NSJ-143]|nr:FCD domain-containing protein [Lachnospiraceae bacterium NSJ-143]
MSKNRDGGREKVLIADLKESIKNQEICYYEKNDINGVTKYDQFFHKKIIYYLENETFNNFFEKHLYQIFKHCASTVSASNSEEEILRSHKRVVDRLENGASYEAYEAIVEHLVYAKKINYEQAINNRKSIFKL